MSFRNCRSISYFFNHPVKVLSSPKWSMQVFTNGRIIAIFCIFLAVFIGGMIYLKFECNNILIAIIVIVVLLLVITCCATGYIMILASIVCYKDFGICDTVLLCFFTSIISMLFLLEENPKQPYVTKKGMNMKAIINGKKYDTETAEKIYQERIGFFGSDAVYRKKNGEFFLHHNPPFLFLFGDKECIEPMNAVELKKCAEAHFSADDYEKVFGPVKE